MGRFWMIAIKFVTNEQSRAQEVDNVKLSVSSSAGHSLPFFLRYKFSQGNETAIVKHTFLNTSNVKSNFHCPLLHFNFTDELVV